MVKLTLLSTVAKSHTAAQRRSSCPKHLCHNSLAIKFWQQGTFHFCSEGSCMSACCWLSCLSWETICIKVHCELHLDFLLPSLPGAIVSLIYHLFGVYYFFIDLLRDIILYAVGLWNYNYCNKPMSNKQINIGQWQSQPLSRVCQPPHVQNTYEL